MKHEYKKLKLEEILRFREPQMQALFEGVQTDREFAEKVKSKYNERVEDFKVKFRLRKAIKRSMAHRFPDLANNLSRGGYIRSDRNEISLLKSAVNLSAYAERS